MAPFGLPNYIGYRMKSTRFLFKGFLKGFYKGSLNVSIRDLWGLGSTRFLSRTLLPFWF